jgi:hypothetical protein
MFGAAVVVVGGVVGFVATTPNADKSDATERLAVPSLVWLTSTGAAEVGPALGASCPRPFKSVLISGGFQGPWQLMVTDPKYTNGTVTLDCHGNATNLLKPPWRRWVIIAPNRRGSPRETSR